MQTVQAEKVTMYQTVTSRKNGTKIVKRKCLRVGKQLFYGNGVVGAWARKQLHATPQKAVDAFVKEIDAGKADEAEWWKSREADKGLLQEQVYNMSASTGYRK